MRVIRMLITFAVVVFAAQAAYSHPLARKGGSATKMVPRTVKKCYRVECNGNSNVCINLTSGGTGGSIEISIPGVASTTQIPCGTGTHGSGDIHTTNVFIFDSADPYHIQGAGYINSDSYVNGTTGTSDISVYDDTAEYTSYTAWHAAY